MLSIIYESILNLNLRNKLFIILFIFSFFIISIPGAVLFGIAYSRFFHNFIEQKTAIGKTIARSLDSSSYSSFIHPDAVNDPEYEDAMEIIRKSKQEEKYITWIYSVIHLKKEDRLVYALDSEISSQDSVWLDNEYFGIRFFLDRDEKPVLSWDSKEYRDRLKIEHDGEVFLFEVMDGDYKGLVLNGQRLLIVTENSPLEISTLSGELDEKDSQKEITVTNGTGLKRIRINATFAAKGRPSSLPGWPFEEASDFKASVMQSIQECRVVQSSEPRRTAYGTFLYIITPIFGPQNKCVGSVILTISPENIVAFRNTMLFAVFGVSLFTLILAVFLSYFLASLVVKPIHELTSAMRQVSAGNMNVNIRMKLKDEFGFLAMNFNEMIANIRKGYENEISLNQIRNELRIAAEIQETILPKSVPEMKGVKVFVTFEPMTQVGGDFYDFYKINDFTLGVIMADVAGHGVPAALVASMLKVAADLEARKSSNPAEILQGINRTMLKSGSNTFITAMFMFLNLKTKKLTISKAGHPPIIIFSKKDSSIREYSFKGRLIGVYEDLKSSRHSIPVSSGERIILYTDGVFEVPNEEDENYGEDRFREFVRAYGTLEPQEFHSLLVKELKEWMNRIDGTFADDMSIVTVDIL
ncbi:MAG TPA: SpoIIE family protein phosphatase [Leptospiraceae bacterium]|nr:SpoIIE family protein phosphatase [Leptospiraceae bacterium]HMY66583.1 SpoIIE family protein phosphatase [Leptospiraceae bacterium]HNF14220.1 SpoIIE family protein phosphatase [Leptospiraceae bacterium]HNF23192.1 SpoIIE family protein phosphatase [Leptospiraceae bacterium]HNM04462.1 SpoIIE family protein phosphatase [Leptospiraceae bacterium]